MLVLIFGVCFFISFKVVFMLGFGIIFWLVDMFKVEGEGGFKYILSKKKYICKMKGNYE